MLCRDHVLEHLAEAEMELRLISFGHVDADIAERRLHSDADAGSIFQIVKAETGPPSLIPRVSDVVEGDDREVLVDGESDL